VSTRALALRVLLHRRVYTALLKPYVGRGNFRARKMKWQNILIAAAAVAVATGTFGQWTTGNPQGGNANWGATPQFSAPPLYGQPEHQTDGGVGATAAAIIEARQQQQQFNQQMLMNAMINAEQARNQRLELQMTAASRGLVIDESNPFNLKVVPAADYRAQQELKAAVRRPIEVLDLDAQSRAKYPNVRAFTTFYERKSGDRIRELNRAAKNMGATRWREDSRKGYRDCWLVTVSFIEDKRASSR
jgi:hypothetical protein